MFNVGFTSKKLFGYVEDLRLPSEIMEIYDDVTLPELPEIPSQEQWIEPGGMDMQMGGM